MSVVSIVECTDYERTRAAGALNEAIVLADLDALFETGKSVLVKPNLLSARSPEDAVTTHPEIVRATAQFALRRGCKTAIGDSPPFAGENPTRWARLCRVTGMTQVANDLKIELRRFEDASVQVASPSGRFYHSFDIAKAVMDTDVLVNAAKLKTHGLTVLTAAVKNVFGCVPGIRKGLFHVRAAEDRETFAQMLVDLCAAVRPAAHVIDAVVAMDGEGPSSGSTKAIRAILASSDPVAIDAVAAALVGIEPMSIATTRLGHEQGLGCGDLAQIEIRGASIDNLRVADFRLSSGANEWAKIPAPIRHVLRRQLLYSPHMDKQACTGCGDCVTGCPMNAITPGRPPFVDYKRCIRCYCCQEVCPASAVRLKSGLLGKAAAWLRRKKRLGCWAASQAQQR